MSDAMKQMKTLKIGDGEAYEVVDAAGRERLGKVEEKVSSLKSGTQIKVSTEEVVTAEGRGTQVNITTSNDLGDGTTQADFETFIIFNGQDGRDGDTITSAEVTMLEPGSEPTAEVVPVSPIPNDKNKILKLGIPAPESTGSTSEDGGSVFGDTENNQAVEYAAAFGFETRALGVGSLSAGDKRDASGAPEVGSEGWDDSYWRYTEAIGGASVAFGMGAVAFSRASKSFGYRTQTGYPTDAIKDNYPTGRYEDGVIGGKGYIHAPDTLSASDKERVNEGSYGQAAFAIGSDTLAAEHNSFAGGSKAQALAKNSFAFGVNTKATNTAIAFGSGTLSSGNNSFAAGMGAQANNRAATAFGESVVASGEKSSAFGDRSQATGLASFAGGTQAVASNTGSVALGGKVTAAGEYSFAAGLNSTSDVDARASVAFGEGTLVQGTHSFVAGDRSQALGQGSFAAGIQTKSSGIGSTALGGTCESQGEYSLAAGYGSESSGAYSVALGYYSTASAMYAVAAGIQAQATKSSSVSLGQGTQSTGASAVALGYCSTASGSNSIAAGYCSTATGFASVALGDHANASGERSVALGAATASGEYSFAAGNSTAEGVFSVAIGQSNTASGKWSFALGQSNTASGHLTFAAGYKNTVSRTGASALGYNNTSSGYSSFVAGQSSIASGHYSAAIGEGVVAGGVNQISVGKWNNSTNDSNIRFSVGNGTSNEDRWDALIVYQDGDVAAQGAFEDNGADYAEMFEWSDGNPGEEDRIGYVVTLDGDKIKKAQSGEDILGIVSGTAGFLGDSSSMQWKHKFITDEFGRVQYEEVESFSEYEDPETHEIISISLGMVKRPILNPDYNPDEEYIPREQRPEWSKVGMLGKLYVRDDGTCVVGGYGAVGTDGVLTDSETPTNVRIMKRTSDNIVWVLMK